MKQFPPIPEGYMTYGQFCLEKNISLHVAKKLIQQRGADELLVQNALDGSLKRYVIPKSLIESFAYNELPDNFERYKSNQEAAKELGMSPSNLHLIIQKLELSDERVVLGSLNNIRCRSVYYSPETIEKIKRLLSEKNRKEFEESRIALSELIKSEYITEDMTAFIMDRMAAVLEPDGLYLFKADIAEFRQVIDDYLETCGFVPLPVLQLALGVSRQRVDQILKAKNVYDDESSCVSIVNTVRPTWYVSRDFLDYMIKWRQNPKIAPSNNEPIKEERFRPASRQNMYDYISLSEVAKAVGMTNPEVLETMDTMGIRDTHSRTKIPNGKWIICKKEVPDMIYEYYRKPRATNA